MSGSDFWTRRKAAVAAEARAEQALADAEHRNAKERAQAEMSDEDVLAEYDLPAPEELESAQDVRAFLQHDLPGRLKTRALRRLWRLNPVLANVDGLVDYGEDFTDAALAVEHLQTAYQVGKGMLAAFQDPGVTDPQTTASAEAAPALEPADEAEPDFSAARISGSSEVAEPPETALPDSSFETVTISTGPEFVRPSSRRMQFQFEAAS